jgi:hypothetical protein
MKICKQLSELSTNTKHMCSIVMHETKQKVFHTQDPTASVNLDVRAINNEPIVVAA